MTLIDAITVVSFVNSGGCARVYRENATGTKIERRELQHLLKAIQPGHVVTVTRIDRLARSTSDLFGNVKTITDAGAQFPSLAEPLTDSATSTGRLMLAVLGRLVDVERDLIHPNGGGPEPRHGSGAAYGPTACSDPAPANRGTAAAAGRGDLEGSG